MSESEVQKKNILWQTMIKYFELEKYDINEECVQIILKDQKSIISVFEKTEEGFLDRMNYEIQKGRQVDGEPLEKEDFLFDSTSIDTLNLVEIERVFGVRRRCIKLHSLTGYEKISIIGKSIGFPNSETLRIYVISKIKAK